MDTLNHELRLEHELWDEHSLVDIIYENKELRSQLACCVDYIERTIKQAEKATRARTTYHCDASEACRGVVQKLTTLLDNLPATAKPLSTKKMGMVWDLIKDVEDEGGRNE